MVDIVRQGSKKRAQARKKQAAKKCSHFMPLPGNAALCHFASIRDGRMICLKQSGPGLCVLAVAKERHDR